MAALWTEPLTLNATTMVLAALIVLCLVLFLWLDFRASRFARFAVEAIRDLDQRRLSHEESIQALAKQVGAHSTPTQPSQNAQGWKRLELEPILAANQALLSHMAEDRQSWVADFEATGILPYLRLDPFFRAIDPSLDFQQIRQGALLRPTQPSAALTAAAAYHRQFMPEHRFDPSPQALDTLLGILAYRHPLNRQAILDRFQGPSEALGDDKTQDGYADEWDVFLSSLTPHFQTYVQLALSTGNFPPPVKVSHADYDRILKTRRLKMGVALGEEDIRKILTMTLMLCGAQVPEDLLGFSPTLKGILIGQPLPLRPCEEFTRGLEAPKEK